VRQTLTGAKLHKTHIKDTTGITCESHASKKSDRDCPKCRTSRRFTSPFYGEWMGRETDSERSVAFVLCRLAFSFVDLSRWE
jgi:hypothetical protein